MDDSTHEKWVSVTEVAAHLGVSKDTVHKLLKNEGLPASKLGKLWKFKISEVDAWLQQHKTNKPQ